MWRVTAIANSGVTALLAISACSSSGPSGAADIAGHFVANASATGETQVAVAFTSTNGVVTGYGWAGIPGPDLVSLRPLVVTGQATAKTVSLTLGYADEPRDALYGIFSGEGNRSELRGTLSRAAQTLSTVFVRVDTTASGTFDGETTGGLVANLAGRAGFATTAPPGFELRLTAPEPSTVVTIRGTERPPLGTHVVEIGTAAPYTGTLAHQGVVYQIAAGSLLITLSGRVVLVGVLRGVGRSSGGPDLQLTARFSAGCPTACR